ncbi:hypothetical protein PINS_up007432 [Pythium insidiosum]|nr:hypothetical protein PINS_up007432 [Pythium insidiosum]
MHDGSHIHGIEIEQESVPAADDLMQHLRLDGDDLERVLGLVEGAGAVTLSTLETTRVDALWQSVEDVSDAEEDEEGSVDDLSDEVENEEQDEDEEEEEEELEPEDKVVTVLVAKPKRQRR